MEVEHLGRDVWQDLQRRMAAAAQGGAWMGHVGDLAGEHRAVVASRYIKIIWMRGSSAP